MRRIISILMIARLIQRLINGSRRPGPRRHQQRRFDEPPQGAPQTGSQAARDEASKGESRPPIEGEVTGRDDERRD
jgi:hypothetical protein